MTIMAENKHINYFKIENFKRFESLEVQDIGQFNLIVGDNNVGKTCLLESLLFDEENYYEYLSNLISSLELSRKVDIFKGNEFDSINVLNFFSKIKESPIKLEFRYDGLSTTFLQLRTVNKSDLTSEDINKLGAKNLIHQSANYLVEFDNSINKTLIYTSIHKEPNLYENYYPFTHFGLSYQDDLIGFFSKISLRSSNYNFLIEELKQFIPELKSIEVNNAIIKNMPILIVRENTIEDVKPISFYGDGLNKFFRYLLEIILCEGKRLMIDEIDTGIHYSRMKQNFKSLISLAIRNNVQLFATTHSKECLQYYKEALEELGLQEKARVIRLVEHKDKNVKAYTYNFEQFEQSLDNENEIR